jgi:hypothetical protein
MNRRAFLFAGLILPMAAPLARAASSDVEVIYVGGQDCPYCTLWQNKYRAQWLASPEFQRVAWTEIDPPHLREAYLERYWPGELKAVLDQVPRKSGTPRFLIVSKGKLVFNAAGADQWERAMRALRNVLG